MRGNRLLSRAGLLVRPLAVAGALLVAAVPAWGHFLWIGLDPQTGAVRLSFGETPEELTQAVPVDKLSAARVLDAAGAPLALVAGAGAFTGTSAGRSITASQSWGVVDRSGDGTGAFLLHYYARAVASAEQAAAAAGLPLEVLAEVRGTRVGLRVQHGASAVASAPVYVHLPSGRTLDLVADADGRAEFEVTETGTWGIRARWMEDTRGELDGKAYGEVRHWVSLTLPLVAAPAAAAGPPASADPAAYALLKGAHDSRQVLPADYPGFRADIVFQKGDVVHEGQVVYRRKGTTDVVIDGLDPEDKAWIVTQVQNQAGHRRGGDFAEGDGRFPLQLGPDDGNPYGRLILVNDALESSYRVKDHTVTEVTRVQDGSRFTISVIETMDGDDGKYLANHFVVTYRDATTGALQKFEAYRDGYARIEGLWLPTTRTILSVGEETSPIVRTLRYRKPVTLEPEVASG